MNIRLMVGLFCAASVCAMGGLMTQAPVALAQGTAKAKSWVEFTADGKAKQPVGYRKWVFLGSPITPNDMNGGEAPFPEFHNTYMDPDSFAHVEKTGEYRDGTVLVKELVAVDLKQEGIIDYKRSHLCLLNLDRLKSLSDVAH